MVSPGANFTLEAELAVPFQLNADLSCAGGQLLALVGPSGSGKSTLLRLIAGLARPVRGRIACGGICWFDSARGIHLPPQQRRIGYVPQHYGLFPHMSALANVMAGLNALPANERQERAMAWMAKVHLGGLEQRRPAELSGGQQQRVALARALAREPAILLLDEPFSAVDRPTRETLYIELAELKRELSLPIVMVTHDLSEAMLLADRMSLLADGKTLQSGPPREVMARPVNESAARLVGVRNFFDGTVMHHDAAEQRTWLKAGEQQLACPLSIGFPPGSRVRWMVPGSAIRLPSLISGDLPPGRNRVTITVQSVLPLGEEARISATLAGIPEPLHLKVPGRLANKLNLQRQTTICVALREQQLHILPK